MRTLLFLLLLACTPAQAATLKIATWNLNWLTTRQYGDPALPRDVAPRDPADFTRLAAYAAQLDADVVAFEEVDGIEAAEKLFPPDRYVLHLTGDNVVQRVGFAIRRGISFTANPDDTALDVYGITAPHHLRSGADITLDLPGGAHVRLLAVHLKSGCQEAAFDKAMQACDALRAQLAPLQDWIGARQQEGVPFIVLGDLNRVMDGDDPMMEQLATAAPLARATEGQANPCWGGERFIDHLLLGGDAMDWLVPDSLRVLVYRETDRSEKSRLSDHCPVSIRLDPSRHPPGATP